MKIGTKYSVNERLNALENAATELQHAIHSIPAGPEGRPGRDANSCFCQDHIDQIDELACKLSHLSDTVAALLDQNKKGAEYIAFLKEKVKRGSNS